MTKKRTLHLLLSLAIVSIVGFGYTFAQVTATDNAMGITALSLNFRISVLSRAWIIFANIAGTLLTNTRVYGSAFGLDSYLWICRNMMKNIANFVLGFIFVFYIFRVMIYKDEAMNVIKTIVIKILVAGIGIQMSRFLTAAILDVSTIATAAVGNLPAHVTSINNSMSDDMKRTVLNWMSASNSQMRTDTEQQKLDKKLQWTLFPTKKSDIAPQENIEIEQIPIQSTITMTEVIDLLMPNAESFAGPLVYLGVSILNTSEALTTVDFTKPIKSTIRVITSGISIMLYSLAMILLSVIAFIRIFYLWIFIILSPILILIYCLSEVGKDKVKAIESISKTLGDQGLSIKSFINLAFKPVIVCLGISLALIFLTLMSSVINEQDKAIGEIEINGIKMSGKENSTENTGGQKNKSYNNKLDSTMVSVTINGLNKTFQELLLAIITIIFMRFIIKIAIASKTGIGVIDKFTDNSTKMIRDVAGKLPIIPIGGGIGIDYIRDSRNNGGNSIINRALSAGQGTLQAAEKSRNQDLARFFGDKDTQLYAADYQQLEAAAEHKTDPQKFIKLTQQFSKDGKRIGLADGQWKQHFVNWIQNNLNNRPQMLPRFTNPEKLPTTGYQEDKLKEFLTKQNLDTYRKLFGGSGTAPKSYEQAIQKTNFE